MSRSRNFMLTIFDASQLPSPSMEWIRYFVYQKERCPETQREHYQTFVQTKRDIRVTTMRRRFSQCHVEVAQHPSAARLYCMKEETRLETPVTNGEFLVRGQRTDLNEFAQLVRSGKRKRQLFQDHAPIFARYRHFYDDCLSLDRPLRAPREVVLYIGCTGSGKTRHAYDTYPDLYSVPVDKHFWFDGYDGEETVLIDDYSGNYPLVLFLRLLHEYPEKVPKKGGFVWWNPKRIIITSNICVQNWYNYEGRDEHLLALQRRIQTTLEFPLQPSGEESALRRQ